MKTIPLSQGKVALVDDIDFAWLSSRTWHAAQAKRGMWYAYSHSSGTDTKLAMHRAIVSQLGLYQVDHRDGNGLNNQRHNLRKCTQSQNNANRRKQSGCTSRFKGVYWRKARQSWIAQLRCKKRYYFLGCFQTEEDAAKAYDKAARVHFGEFACTNFS